MNSGLSNVLLPILITVGPFFITLYKGGKSDYLKSLGWGIISFIISFLLFKGLKIDIIWPSIIISTIGSTIFNILMIRDYIKVRKLPKSALVLILFFFASLFQLIPIAIYNLDVDKITASQNSYLTLFSDLVLLIILFLMYRKDIINYFKEFKKNKYPIIDTGFKYWLIGLIVMVVANLLINFLVPGAVAGNENQVQDIIHAAPIASLICVGVLAPIIEELTFRKAFRDILPNKWLFIFASGIIFGGLHVIFSFNSWQDLLYLIPYCSLGFAFAAMYVKTDNIFASIITHMFHNFCLTLLSIITALGTAVILW